LIERAFTLGCPASRNDADDLAMSTLAMADDEQSGARTHAQHQKMLFVLRILFIEELNGEFAIED